MQLIVHTPINNLSLGNVGFNLLRECYKAGHQVGWFPVGQSDLSAFKVTEDFVAWLQNAANNRFRFLGQGLPALVNWHINGSERLYSDKQILLTYHETNKATNVERSIVSNQYKTLFCGGYSERVFFKAGLANVGSFNLGLDEEFVCAERKYLPNKVHWLLCGKHEKRKNTAQIIRLWSQKYGNTQDHVLTLLTTNPFYGNNPQEAETANRQVIAEALGGKRYFNINILPRLQTNSEVCDLINNIDIDLSGLGSESWGLPSFNATCLGKWSTVMYDRGQSAWANANNCILVESDGQTECYDDAFFKKGTDYNQGSFCVLKDETIINAFERAESKVGTVNENGISLGAKMTYGESLKQILSHI